MHRLHILDKVIINEYLKRNKNDDWHDEEYRDDEEFLKVKEELWSTYHVPGTSVSSDGAGQGQYQAYIGFCRAYLHQMLLMKEITCAFFLDDECDDVMDILIFQCQKMI